MGRGFAYADGGVSRYDLLQHTPASVLRIRTGQRRSLDSCMRNQMFPFMNIFVPPRPASPARAVLTALLGALALSGCGGGSGSGGAEATSAATVAPTPPASAVHSFLFRRSALPGVYGNATIAYSTPPYQFGTANDGQGHLVALDLKAIGVSGIWQSPRVPYDVRFADVNGDGIPDVISSVY